MDKWSEYQMDIQCQNCIVYEQHEELILYRYYDMLEHEETYVVVLDDNIIHISNCYPHDVLCAVRKVYEIMR